MRVFGTALFGNYLRCIGRTAIVARYRKATTLYFFRDSENLKPRMSCTRTRWKSKEKVGYREWTFEMTDSRMGWHATPHRENV